MFLNNQQLLNVCTYLALHNFSNSWIQIRHCHPHFLVYIDFHNLVLGFYYSDHWKYNFAKLWCQQNVMCSNIEIINSLELVVHIVSDRGWISLCFPQKFKTLCNEPVSLLKCSGNPSTQFGNLDLWKIDFKAQGRRDIVPLQETPEGKAP